MTDDTSSKPWGGRFTESSDAFVEDFTASIGFDHRLYRHDITGSIAHARMLAHVNIITDAEADEIVNGLELILADIEQGNFNWSVGLEDIHMNIEARLIERIGDTGKKLHTGRSRNDQV
ncbi:MAG: argininosuccinate lyase, partial [Gammaproteobacteria bacterium]|nr:argininosuccinate lyase [Gammaproteobacteria bacterium]